MIAREITLPTSWGVHAVYRLLESEESASVLAVEFPGAHYGVEKPPFHFIRKSALQMGIDTLSLEYGYQAARVKTDFPEEVLRTIVDDLANVWDSVALDKYERILFISKSMGTLIAGRMAEKLHVPIEHVFLTPLRATLPYMRESCLVVTGTEDPLFPADVREQIPEGTEVLLVQGADHGLETPDWKESLEIVRMIAERLEAFMRRKM